MSLRRRVRRSGEKVGTEGRLATPKPRDLGFKDHDTPHFPKKKQQGSRIREVPRMPEATACHSFPELMFSYQTSRQEVT